MNLKGTMRRTLAMLLVLIFALSNMGLAEMAEQIADVPVVEEVSNEAASTDAAAPEAEQQDDGDAQDVPAAGPSALEPPTDAEPAPEEPGVEVSVEVSQIDGTSLCAYESIAPEGVYDVAYAWERAASEDGEWEALEETSDVYSTKAADRFDYVYRCTVTVDGTSATSAAVAYDAEAYADELEGDETSIEAAQLNEGGDLKSVNIDLSIESLLNESYLPVDTTGGGDITLTFTATLKDYVPAGGEKLTYQWTLSSSNFEAVGSDDGNHSDKGATDTFAIKVRNKETVTAISNTQLTTEELKVKVSSSLAESDLEGSKSKEVNLPRDITLVPMLASAETVNGYSVKLGNDKKETENFKNGDVETKVKPKVYKSESEELAAIYAPFITYKFTKGASGDATESFTGNATNGFNVPALAKSQTTKDTYTVSAEIAHEIIKGAEQDATTGTNATVNVQPALGDGDLTITGANVLMIGEGSSIELTATPKEGLAIADYYQDDLEWEYNFAMSSGTKTEYIESLEAKGENKLIQTATAATSNPIALDALGKDFTVTLKSGATELANTTITVLRKLTSNDISGKSITLAPATISKGGSVNASISGISPRYTVEYKVADDGGLLAVDQSTGTITWADEKDDIAGATQTAHVTAEVDPTQADGFNLAQAALTMTKSASELTLTPADDVTLVGPNASVELTVAAAAEGGSAYDESTIQWVVTGDTDGIASNLTHYLSFEWGSSQKATDSKDIEKGQTKLKLVVPKGITEAKDGITVKATANAGGKTIESKPVNIKIVKALDADGVTDEKYPLDVAAEIPEPLTGEAGEFTAKLPAALADYPVVWSVDSSAPGDIIVVDDDTASGKFTVSDFNTSKEMWTGDTASTGVEYTLQAVVTCGFGDSGDKQIATLSKTVVVRPVPEKVSLETRTKKTTPASGSSSTETTTYERDTADIDIAGADNKFEQGKDVYIGLKLVGPSYDTDASHTVTPYAGETPKWTVKKKNATATEAGAWDPVAPNKVDNGKILKLDTSTLDTYQITAALAAANASSVPAEVEILPAAQQIVLSTENDARTLYVVKKEDGSYQNNFINVTASAQTLQGDDAFDGNINWKIADLPEGVSVVQPDEGNTAWGTPDTPPKGTTKIRILVGQTFAATGSDTVNITVYNGENDSTTVRNQITIAIQEGLKDDPFETEPSDSNPVISLDKEEIAQGDTAIVSIHPEVEAKIPAGYTKHYSIAVDADSEPTAKGKNEQNVTAENIGDWITIDPTSGIITAKPLGEKNVFTNVEAHIFTVTVELVGTGYHAETDIQLFPNPVGAKVVAANATTGVSQPTVTLPPVLSKDMEFAFIAVPVGPLVDPEVPTSGEIPVIAEHPALSFNIANLVSSAPIMTGDGNATNSGAYKLTVVNAGDLEITATINGHTSEPVKIKLIDETALITPASTTACTGGGSHKWILDLDRNSMPQEYTADGTKGHAYKCANGCNVLAYAPHGSWTPTACDTHAEDGFDETCEDCQNTMACAICGYECDHPNYPTEKNDAVSYKDSTYHVWTCDICGAEAKQKHVDDVGHDAICDICGGADAQGTIYVAGTTATAQPIVLVKGDKKQLSISINNADTWETAWSSDAQDFVSVDETGLMEAKQMTAKDQIVTITATVTVPGTETPITETLKVQVSEIPSAITVEAEGDAYVVAAATDDAVKYTKGDKSFIKLVANTGSTETPALDDFKWTAKFTQSTEATDPINSASVDNYVSFYPAGDDGTPDVSMEYTTATMGTGVTGSVIWVYAKHVNSANGSVLQRLQVNYEYSPAGGAASTVTPTSEPATLDYYDAPVDKVLGDAISLDKTKVGQGDSVKISVADTYNETIYGPISFTVKGDDLTEYETTKWVTPDFANKNIAVLADDGVNNAAPVNGKQFTITATVGESGKAGHMTATKTFTVVAAPDGVQLQIDKAGKYEAVVGSEIETDPTMPVKLKVVPTKEGKAITDTTIDDDSFSWTINGATTFPANSETVDVTEARGEYAVTIKTNAPADTTVSVEVSSKFGTQSATIKLRPTISSISLSAAVSGEITEAPALAVGEQAMTDAGLINKEVTVEATITPEDATDEWTWLVEYPTDSNISGTASYTRVNKDDPAKIKIAMPADGSITANKAGKINVTAYVDADGNGKIDTNEIKSETITITVYHSITASSAATAIKATFKDGITTLTKGETLEFAQLGYAEGYGASVPLAKPVVVIEPQTGVETPEKVLEIIGGGTKDSPWKVKAVGEGKAHVELYAYNHDQVLAAKATSATITVSPQADDVTIEEGTIPEGGITLYMDDAEKSKTELLASAFKAVYNATEEGGNPTEISGAKVELVINEPDTEVAKIEFIPAVTAAQPAQSTPAKWVLTAVKDGSATIHVMVGDNEFKTIPVTVQAAPAGVSFSIDDAPYADAQKVLAIGDASITITAKAAPEGAYGDVTIEVANVSGEIATLSEDGKSVEISTEAEGNARVTAKILNPSYNPDGTNGPDNRQCIQGHLDVVVVGQIKTEEPTNSPTPSPTPTDEPTPTPTATPIPWIAAKSIAISGKTVIAKGEKTQAVVIGGDKDDEVEWSVDPTDEFVAIDENGVITWKAAGMATISAIVNGEEIANTLEVYTLTETTKVELKDQRPTKMAVGESMEVEGVPDGYEFAEEYPDADYFSVDYPDVTISGDGTILSVKGNAYVGYTVTALKAGKGTLTLKCGDVTSTAEIEVVKANKSFTIGDFANSTKYVKPGEKITVYPKFTPAASYANVTFNVVMLYGEDEAAGEFADFDDIAIKYNTDSVELTLAEDVQPGWRYEIEASANGFTTGRQEQRFWIEAAASEEDMGATLSITVDKIGVDGSAQSGSATVAKNEKLQAKLVDEDGHIFGGDVTWTTSKKGVAVVGNTGVITAEKKGTATITATSAKGSASFTLQVANPKSVKLDKDTRTERTVALNEVFYVGLEENYVGNAKKWYSVTSNDDGFKEVYDEDEENIIGYMFESVYDEEDDAYYGTEPGTKDVTLTTAWGAKKTVKFNVVADKASEIELLPKAEGLSMSKTGTLVVKANLLDEDGNAAYANLNWTIDGKPLDPKKTGNQKIDATKVQAKLVANDEILITTKKATNASIELHVEAAGDETVFADATIAIAAEPSGTLSSEDVEIQLTNGKTVIGKGEAVQAYIVLKDTAIAENVTLPSGKITFKMEKDSSTGSVTVSNNKITGKKEGNVTLVAYVNNEPTSVKLPIQVVDAAKVSINTKPKKMGSEECIRAELTISGYGEGKTLPEGLELQMNDLLTVKSSSDLIEAQIAPKFDLNEEDEPVQVPRKYVLTLTADQARKNAKGKYESATVTVYLCGKSAIKMPIQVVESTSYNNLYFPSDIYIQAGKSYALNAAVADNANHYANITWSFATPEDEAAANKIQLHFTNKGTLQSTKNTSTAPEGIKMIGRMYMYGYENEIYKTTVHVGQKISNKNQFELVMPKLTMGVGEVMQAFTRPQAGYAGQPVFTSSKKKFATIDKTTGLITAKAVGKTKITAKINGKSQQAELTVVAAPTGIEFQTNPIYIEQGEDVVVDLGKYIKLTPDGATITAGNRESAYIITQVSMTDFDGNVYEYDEDFDFDAYYTQQTAGKLMIPNDFKGMVRVQVASYNGYTASGLVVIGEPEIVDPDATATPEITPTPTPTVTPTPSPTPTPVLDAASLELWLGGYAVENDSTQPLTEGKDYEIKAVVKDASGQAIPDAGVTYAITDRDCGEVDAEHVSIDGNVLHALKYTYDGQYQVQKPIKITASVPGTESVEPISFSVTIATVFDASYIDFEERIDLVIGQSVQLKNADFTAPEYKGKNITFEYKIKGEDEIAAADKIVEKTDMTLKGVKIGEAILEVKAVYTAANESATKEVPITVHAEPTDANLTLDITGEEVTMVEGESFDFAASLKDYAVEPAAQDYRVTILNISNGASGVPATGKLTFANRQTTGTPATADPGKFRLTADASNGKGTYKVSVVVFSGLNGDDPNAKHATKSFTVKVLDAPSIQIAAPAQVAKGEPASLKYTITPGTDGATRYTDDIEWYVATSSIPATDYTIENKDAQKTTITYTGTSASAIAVGLRFVKTQTPVGSPRNINLRAVPTSTSTGATVGLRSSSGTISQASTTVTIGEKEWVDVGVSFTGSVTTNKIEWTANIPGKVEIIPDPDNPDDTTKARVVGIAQNTPAVLTVSATYKGASGDVVLGTINFTVAPEATSFTLQKNGAAFDYKLSSGNTLTVLPGPDGASATYTIEILDISTPANVTAKAGTSHADRNTFMVGTVQSTHKLMISVKDQSGKTLKSFSATAQ